VRAAFRWQGAPSYHALDEIEREVALEVHERQPREELVRRTPEGRARQDGDARVLQQLCAQLLVRRDPAQRERLAMPSEAREQVEPGLGNLHLDVHLLQLVGEPATDELQRLLALALVRGQLDTTTERPSNTPEQKDKLESCWRCLLVGTGGLRGRTRERTLVAQRTG
jgi:hypothetical protein